MATTTPSAPPPAAPGTWDALQHGVFRAFWSFSFLAFVGAGMQNVGAGWLMTELDPSPQRVSLVQAAFSLSGFVMGLPAGVIADLVDRRYVMLAALATLMAISTLLGVLTIAGAMTPDRLVVLTFLFGAAAATITPAMQATTPDLVPREHLPSALTLNGMTNSIARAVGPALAGLLLGTWGAGYMFVGNALTFVGLAVVIFAWRHRPEHRPFSAASFRGALLEGLAFSLRRAPLRRLLLKMALLFLMVSVLLALMPLVVADLLDGRPQTLGVLLACFGVGSVAGSLALGRLYARFSRSRVVDFGAVGHALAVLGVCLAPNRYAAAAAMLLAGFSWTAMLTSVSIVAQLLLPAAVRARGLSINMMTMLGALALGAAAWGRVAEIYGLRATFFAAACGGLVMPFLTARLVLVEQLDDVPPGVPVRRDGAGRGA